VKKISIWAKGHVWQSRLLIIFIYILLNVLGIFTGKLLREVNVVIPQLYFTSFVVFTILLWVLYPGNKDPKTGKKRGLYFRRKLFDFSLGTVTFLMIIYIGNNWKSLPVKSESAQASKIIRIPKDSAISNSPLIKNFITSIKNMDVSKLTPREKIRIIKKQIRTIREDNETSKGEKTVLIIVSVLLAIGLLIGLAALSCSIACSGSEAVAVIVALAGTFLIVFLLIRTIKRISNRPKQKKEPAEDKKIIP